MVRSEECVVRNGGRRARQIALIRIGIHSKTPFYIARRMLTTNRVRFHAKRYTKVIILLIAISNIEC